MAHTPTVYWLESNQAPWGDYGRLLLNGMSSHLPRLNGMLQLERAAPLVPPITFPRRGDVIITGALRERLDKELGCTIAVKPVHKAKIVRIDWQDWPREETPLLWPESRDPEDYLLMQEHDPGLCEQVGDLWEIDPPTVGRGSLEVFVDRGRPEGRKRLPPRFRVSAELPRELPSFFRVERVPFVFVRDDVGDKLLALTENGCRLMPVEAQFVS